MSTLPHLAQLPWQPGFADWGAQFSRPQPATPLPDLHWVSYNEALRADMQLPTDWWQNPRVLAALGGNAPLPGSTPSASVYSGHQFGVWAGQLGDGRALNLGALATPMGVLELQLKGAGKTPYSRMGDGRAVLRSSIREYLASEAMWGLNIPTTRALCVVGSPQPVRRETIETAAVVTRVSPSFVRFGHFEHFAALNDTDSLWLLIRHLQPLLGLPSHAEADAQPVLDFLRVVVERTATLLAQWQCVGFCHGVMNTDNMSILGLTLDYGPFQFMDGFDVHHICNHSDTGGRYAFGRQPQVAYWNLFCLGQALLPLVPAQEDVVRVLETFKPHFAQSFTLGMNAKLGLSDVHETDADLQQDLLQLLDREHVDWTVFWRRLSVAVQSDAFEPVRDLFIDRDAWQAWLARYWARLDAQCATSQLSRHACGQTMLRINPKYVLRNYLAELAIADAKVGDYACLHDLLTVLHSPFDEHPQHEAWAQVAPEWASRIEVSCSS